MPTTTEVQPAEPASARARVMSFAEAFERLGGDRDRMRELLGGKGAGLAEMTAAGVAVPPGVTITTSCCRDYHKHGGKFPEGLFEEVKEKLAEIERETGQALGSTTAPLLLSVRSGAKFSMPGMMDTILNLGLNDDTVEGLAALTGNPRFAYDSYRRFIQMYSNVVFDLSKDRLEDIMLDLKDELALKHDTDLGADHLIELVGRYKRFIRAERSIDFPQNTDEQLRGAIEAVFRSWNNTRAVYYRNLNKIDHSIGTAVTIQAMVFGNFDFTSATGVCFTRNPSTGERTLYGEYLLNAQGEDVVAGIRNPEKIAGMARTLPGVYRQLEETAGRLERHYKEMQDIEFTVQQGRLYLLQTRTGKRTAQAAIKIAVDMVDEGIIPRETAVARVEPGQLNQLLLPSFDAGDKELAGKQGRLLAVGLNASPGAAIGEIVFDPSESEKLAEQGRKVILVRVETCPDDIHGIVSAQGVITSRGGMTSHAAVVARGMGKPCVAGCEALQVDQDKGEIQVSGRTLRRGEIVSLDGSTGEIFAGPISTHEPELSEEFRTLLGWADDIRRLRVRANADTPEDAHRAREFKAEGIGLCRTEHMFMSPERLPVVREMILAADATEREAALAKLLPMQRQDFIGIFKAMAGLPVTVRLLDPPLHEFLPKHEELIEEVARLKAEGTATSQLKNAQQLLFKVEQLRESNPMMGLRGCRLGLTFPEINRMQVQAIFEAAIAVKRQGIDVLPEVMIPLVGHVNELKVSRAMLEATAKAVMERAGLEVDYKFGTMIEIPRACVTANEIAEYAEFFSFGTNDLTQMTFGYSRDDAEGKFLQRYLEGIEWDGENHRILSSNPFEVLDQSGVGKLMKLAVEYGLQTRPDLKLGICGEHGGDPGSIAFAHQLGLSYVSCSPYRVPLARLAAAQATLATVERDR